ncbi:MAG: class I SAM-dependent methyltransferase [Burkholderiaceae bacterium]|jgi:malonyl-CoA O-methyltransferase|nr:class I SAM-dependent methyltransferase [Burkholderiaceae bacterium]
MAQPPTLKAQRSTPNAQRWPDPRAAVRWARLAGGDAPWLHEEVARRMAERLAFIRLPVQRWADWSPERGGREGHAQVAAHYPDAECFLVSDYAEHGQCASKNKVSPFIRRELALPQNVPPPGSLHLVWANMLLHQISEPAALLEQWRRALAAGGFLMFSCLGPDTLRELRALYRRHGWGEAAQHFTDMHDLGDMLLAAGFAEPVMDMERITLTFATHERLLAELRELGRNLHPGRFAGLRTRAWRANLLRAMDEELRGGSRQAPMALSFEIIYGHALGAPERAAVAPRTEVSLDAMQQALRSTAAGRSGAAPTES